MLRQIALSGTSKERAGWPKTIEVDVVAQEGHLWVEVKDTEWFGIGSTRWLGTGGRSAGKSEAIEEIRFNFVPIWILMSFLKAKLTTQATLASL